VNEFIACGRITAANPISPVTMIPELSPVVVPKLSSKTFSAIED